jgi:glycosyltransferase involved in cell wall biosynthesis
VRTWARRSLEGAAASALGAVRRRGGRPAIRVGWVAAEAREGGNRKLSRLHPPVSMRITNTAFWINAHSGRVVNELYHPGRRYDVVVFFKAMQGWYLEEAERVRRTGARIVFDANVNYYERWGDYDIERTEPTLEQQRDAIAMTELADHVVADSTYLRDVVAGINERVTWIPDNVDLRVYRPGPKRRATAPLKLVWSGVAQKAAHLLEAADAFASVSGIELTLVADRPPEAMTELAAALPCRFVRFGDRRYAASLRASDVIVSPKRLTNAYEVAHTEYKITLGMAARLPAVASPQRSYVEAIGHAGGGIVASSDDEWRRALERLRDDHEHRAELGGRARRTVEEVYATPVVSARYLRLLEGLA